MYNVIIRKPTLEEIDELLILWSNQYKYHHDLDSDYYVSNSEELKEKFKLYIEQSIKSDSPHTSVAIIDESIVGFITYEIDIESYFDTKIKRYGNVIELFVSKDHRYKHIGNALMEKAESFFKSENVNWVEIQASSSNTAASEFYQKLGYNVKQVLLFKKI